MSKCRWNLFQTASQFCSMELWKQQGSEWSNSSKKPRRSWAHAVCMSWFSSSCAFCVTETMHLLTIDTSLHCSSYWIAASSKTTTEMFKGATKWLLFTIILCKAASWQKREETRTRVKKGMGTCIRVSQPDSRIPSYLLLLPNLQLSCALNSVFVFPLRLLALQQCQKIIIKVHPKTQNLINQHCPQCHMPSALILDKEKARSE